MEEHDYLEKILLEIEEKFQNGESQFWTHNEYSKLSQQVFDASEISVSIKTLKRLFENIKANVNYNPQNETKNALAIYLGYKNWYNFKYKKGFHSEEKTGLLFLNKNYKLLLWASGIIVTGLIIFFAAKNGLFYQYSSLSKEGKFNSKTLNSDDFIFTGKNLEGYVPLTCIFNYDLSNIKADSIFISYFYGNKEPLTNLKGQRSMPVIPK